jgi:hypothetical protein
MFTGKLAEAAIGKFQASQDSLYALARDTGGKALLDYNDLSLGIVQAAQALTSYYIIGYQSTHTQNDGKFRRVRITLRGERLQAELTYRQGYYADKVFDRFSTAEKERQLEEALMLEDPMTEITIAMEVNYFQLNNAEYFVASWPWPSVAARAGRSWTSSARSRTTTAIRSRTSVTSSISI